jgi:glyoxylate reductase
MPFQVLSNIQLPEAYSAMAGGQIELSVWRGDATDPALLQAAEGLWLVGHSLIDGAVMDTMPSLRVISNTGVGVDHIIVADADDRGIAVGNTPGFVDGATADLTFAILMAVARNVITGDRYARSPEFTTYDPLMLYGSEVHGSTLGIIGMGAIGRQVAKRARGFDMPVFYHNRNRDRQAESEVNAVYASLHDLLAQSDFVTLNVPMTDETANMIGRAELRQMKESAFLINMARGGVVDHDALVEALQAGWIAGAALDVTEPEPLPRDHPLLTMDNVVIMPHLGSATRQTRDGMVQRAVDNLLAGLKREPLLSPVVAR